ncbi:amidase domain-containing protein, partial [Bacillus cereus]|uniref:amidase domain-containing protein n=2 Tax=Bacillota TaxID=1239 RepID=UPI00214A4901
MLKKVTILILVAVTIATSSIPKVVSASNNVELLEEVKKHKVMKIDKPAEVEELSEEERETDRKESEEIKKRGEESIKANIESDVEAIKELADILVDTELLEKAGPITEIPVEDIIYIMDVILDSIENYKIELSDELKNKLTSYLLSHGPYVGSDKVKEYIEKNTQSNRMSVRSSYNRQSAVDYAFKWVHSYNTTYYPNLTNLGGDCTNFVSQAVVAGGHQQSGTWWIRKTSNTYLAPINSYQYRHSWSSSWPEDSAWIYAPAFAVHWQPKVLTGEYNASFVVDTPQTPYAAPYYLGD